ncbi:MAG TPA: cytochrome c [Candidatus Krumholzibacteria bacterium]|nr:cytochrome c [Candidatus Krumholzibacteria bacterium]HPD70722.1 cytochrome c [Candidatus Krumholzibacteria bacterium]HRY39578.1 cytochrome c [Candidatus Krumholzibacteria bacterium]
MPRPLIYVAAILLALTVVPMACIVKNWYSPVKAATRIQIVPDMDDQPRFKAQTANPFFADGRAMRPWPAGTVPRGMLREDGRLYRAIEPDSTFTTAFPLPVTESLLSRGRERFDIYCATCHGLGGAGDGVTHRRAEALQQGTWTPPTDLASETVVGRSSGHLYQTITNGLRTMPAYGHQIPPEDRWAIVAYVRALQRARNATLDDVPEANRRQLR